MKRVCVFCGSSAGGRPVYREAAQALGGVLARRGAELVFGGGRVGLMGVLADAALAAGGTVFGVIPDFITKWEVAHETLSERLVVETMHQRKARMAEESDAFVALPGGIGTLDEIVEIISWRQLRLHDKPIFICDVAGSAMPLVRAVDTAIEQGFLGPEGRDLFTVAENVPDLLDRLTAGAAIPHAGTIAPGIAGA